MHNHVGEGRFVAFAVLAAALYALSTPFSKILLQDVPSNMMAAFLYLGAGLGMAAVGFVHAVRTKEARSVRTEEPLSREDLPFVLAMVALDVAAPLLLMAGLSHAPAENVALLNNFEIVATALIALAVFREPVSRRLWARLH